MASEKDFELLDDYLGNRLNSQEKQAFEEKLKSDADLRGEYDIQQQIIQNLRSARASQLKARLNEIPISSIPSGPSTIGRWGWPAAVAVVAAGLYFYLQPESSTTPVKSKSDTTTIQAPLPAEDDEVIAEAPTKNEGDNAAIEKETQPAEAAKPKESVKSRDTAASTETTPNIDVYDPSGESPELKTEALPSPKESNAAAHKSDVPTEIISSNKNFRFHYQFKEQKLILFGPFDKDLYEILEFFSDNKRTMFLYYKSSYYLLDQTGEKVKPLSPVNDPHLIQKLKEYSSQ